MAIENINTDVWNGHRYGEVKQLLLTTLRGLISKLEGYDAVAGKANSALQPGDIVNGFDSDATDKMLSAAAGKLLKGLLDGKASLDEYTGRLAYTQAPQVVLASMGDGFDDVDIADVINVEHRVNFVYYDGLDIQYVDANGDINPVGRPQKSLIYCNESTDKLYRYLGSGNGWQEVSSEGDIDLSGKADLLAGMLTPSQWPQIVLRNVTDTMLDNLVDGDVYFDSGILYRYHASAAADTIGEPVKSAIYFCLADKKYYRWNGSAFVRADEFVTLNDLVSEGVVFAEDGDDVHRVVTDESGRIKPSDLPAVVLDGINRTNTIYSDAANTELAGKTFHYGTQQSTIIQGTFGGATDRIVTWYMAGGTMRYVSYIPDPRLLYFDKSSGKLYRWDAENYQLVSVTKKAVASFIFAQATTPNTNPTLEITYTDNTTDSVELAIGGNGSVGPNPQQQVRLTTVEVTEVGSGPLEDAVDKASDEEFAETCFQWILTDTDSTTGTVFRKVIWHAGGGVFIDAYGTVIYEPEEEENNNNNNDTSSPAQ